MAYEREKHSNENRTLRGGYGKVPAVLIALEKGNGIFDASRFYFYKFNRGNSILGVH